MDDAELFDVFEVEDSVETVPLKPAKATKEHRTKKSKKEHKEKKKSTPHQDDEDVSSKNKRALEQRHFNGDDMPEDSRKSKKSRKIEPQPIVVDSFETETEQIVPATQGLQGTPLTSADQNIVIKKRVCVLIPLVC